MRFVFYNWGLSCAPQLYVAISSFRKHHPTEACDLLVPRWDESKSEYIPTCVKQFDVQPLIIDIPSPTKNPQIKHNAKLYFLWAYPYDDQVACYESDMLFLSSVKDLSEFKCDFGMCWLFTAYFGSKWYRNHIFRRYPIMHRFPYKEVLLDPSLKFHNAGLFYVNPRSNVIKEILQLVKIAKPFEQSVHRCTFGEEIMANIFLHRNPDKCMTLPYVYNQDMRLLHHPRYNDVIPDIRVYHYVNKAYCDAWRMREPVLRAWWDHFSTLKNLPEFPLFFTWQPALKEWYERYLSGNFFK